MCLNPTLCIGALRTGDVMQRLSPPVHPYKVAARQISCMPRSTQAHKRLVRGKLSFSCQSRKWSCYCLGNITIPLLACSLPWEANIIFFFFFWRRNYFGLTHLLSSITYIFLLWALLSIKKRRTPGHSVSHRSSLPPALQRINSMCKAYLA